MNINSKHGQADNSGDTRPILIVPYMWIGDFVRGHTVVRVLKQRWPNRPVDLLATSLCAPLVDYMPGVRSAIICDLAQLVTPPAGSAPLRGDALATVELTEEAFLLCEDGVIAHHGEANTC